MGDIVRVACIYGQLYVSVVTIRSLGGHMLRHVRVLDDPAFLHGWLHKR